MNDHRETQGHPQRCSSDTMSGARRGSYRILYRLDDAHKLITVSRVKPPCARVPQTITPTPLRAYR